MSSSLPYCHALNATAFLSRLLPLPMHGRGASDFNKRWLRERIVKVLIKRSIAMTRLQSHLHGNHKARKTLGRHKTEFSGLSGRAIFNSGP